MIVVFGITEIQRAEEFLQTNDGSATAGSLPYSVDCFIEIRCLIGRAAHLYQSYLYLTHIWKV
jgi:hypothetical protein